MKICSTAFLFVVLCFCGTPAAIGQQSGGSAAPYGDDKDVMVNPASRTGAQVYPRSGTHTIDEKPEVETVIITGKGASNSIVRFKSGPANSGLQINTLTEKTEGRARRIAEQNLKAGEVGAAVNETVKLNDTVKTTIRIDDVIVKSKRGDSESCARIGVVATSTDCRSGARR